MGFAISDVVFTNVATEKNLALNFYMTNAAGEKLSSKKRFAIALNE